MREKLITAYADALGDGARSNPIVMTDIERAADLVLLARDMRAAVHLGKARVADLTRLEGASDRAVRRLGLPAPNAAVPTLSQYLVAHEAEHEHEKP